MITDREKQEDACCADENQELTDDGEVIYPHLCPCICHTPND